MFVSATMLNEYLFIPAGKEYRPFSRFFKGAVNQTDQGYTLAAYADIPYYTVKDAEYFEAVATESRSFDDRQALLSSLKLCPNLGDGAILDASKGLRMPVGNTITANLTGMVFNHIPQLLELYNGDQVLTGFTGNYDFKIGLFKGQASFMRYADLWSD